MMLFCIFRATPHEHKRCPNIFFALLAAVRQVRPRQRAGGAAGSAFGGARVLLLHGKRADDFAQFNIIIVTDAMQRRVC